MASIYLDVRRRGGIARTYELLADGHTSHQLTGAVRRGEIVRVRQGHYCTPELSEVEQFAVRIGGRLTGLSGARSLGIWTPPDRRLHIAVAPDARALRTARDPRRRRARHPDPATVVRWTDKRRPGTRSRLDAAECLREIAQRESAIVAFAAAESALHQGFITRTSVGSLGLGRYASAVNRLSESGGESLMKFGLLALRTPFRQQVAIVGVGRVDFLIGDRLVIEVDGAEFHTSREAFENDRRRDALLATLGYRVLRFSYRQVEGQWPEVSGAIAAALARGEQW
ncbi:MAG: DUF559 domain-containing protein [Rhodoglobus sp.]